MKRLISALTIALLVLGPVCGLLTADAAASAGLAAGMSHDGHAMPMSGGEDGGMDDTCPMTDPGACCGIAGGHCATGVVAGAIIAHPAGDTAEAVLPEIDSARLGTPADIDIPPPRV